MDVILENNQPLSQQAARYEEREEGFGAAASCGELPDPLEIKPETAETLAAQARTMGLSVDEYVKLPLGILNDEKKASAPTLAEFEADMQSLPEVGNTSTWLL